MGIDFSPIILFAVGAGVALIMAVLLLIVGVFFEMNSATAIFIIILTGFIGGLIAAAKL